MTKDDFLKAIEAMHQLVGLASCEDADEDANRRSIYCIADNAINDYKHNKRLNNKSFIEDLKAESVYGQWTDYPNRIEEVKLIDKKFDDAIKAFENGEIK